MGNLVCSAKRKKVSDVNNESDEDNSTNAAQGGQAQIQHKVDKDTNGPKEEVLYATIDHGNGKKAGNMVQVVEGDDCDYAIVKIPSEDKLSIREDCSDDYVLMG
ncbi:hypothetical protein AALO_G00036860 [Alosa alosa]|uniref:Uncharacterized protein n=1 Tax=Alosa alosa TaxID=278164 RepID=A0AAV6HAI1_9TELE|nr:uncharacterized protein si:ch211-214p13.7 isoform X1 [Alosa sapidissima]XP_048095640.1 uncharacterized protein si:ch211-214p13.7 isoform X1 [Alosa alosa]KAG5282976.1 hypothetical protein AALO_G00036860 [Alosa alosa]